MNERALERMRYKLLDGRVARTLCSEARAVVQSFFESNVASKHGLSPNRASAQNWSPINFPWDRQSKLAEHRRREVGEPRLVLGDTSVTD
jgi:hypothetical protein